MRRRPPRGVAAVLEPKEVRELRRLFAPPPVQIAGLYEPGVRIVEEILVNGKPKFLMKDDSGLHVEEFVRSLAGRKFVPIDDGILRGGAVVLPSGTEPFGDVRTLFNDMVSFVTEYAEVPGTGRRNPS